MTELVCRTVTCFRTLSVQSRWYGRWYQWRLPTCRHHPQQQGSSISAPHGITHMIWVDSAVVLRKPPSTAGFGSNFISCRLRIPTNSKRYSTILKLWRRRLHPNAYIPGFGAPRFISLAFGLPTFLFPCSRRHAPATLVNWLPLALPTLAPWKRPRWILTPTSPNCSPSLCQS